MSIKDKPIGMFCEAPEPGALHQFYEAMAQDFVVQGALMPDAHQGYSLPIGAAVLTVGKVVPAYVGYDIGCGMCAVPTTFRPEEVGDKAQLIFERLYETVPTGYSVHPRGQKTNLDPSQLTHEGRKVFDKRKGFKALGTLGGGNHFIEVAQETAGAGLVWIVIHSGSRGPGHGIATHYMRLASGSTRAKEGHYALDQFDDDGKAYINDMNWMLQFALANRLAILAQVEGVLHEVLGHGHYSKANLINRNHNHAELMPGMETAWVHRKGATHAEDGMWGVVPGNMRDGSFIVRGKGCARALNSSSHGAGRVLGRKQAKRTLDMGEFADTMQGVVAKVDETTLDESPMAYKDIHHVMAQQDELVEVVHHVKPILNVKA